MIEERLVELETQITFQDQTIKDLSDVIYKQQQELERLATLCAALERQSKELAESDQGSDVPVNEKPPHY